MTEDFVDTCYAVQEHTELEDDTVLCFSETYEYKKYESNVIKLLLINKYRPKNLLLKLKKE